MSSEACGLLEREQEFAKLEGLIGATVGGEAGVGLIEGAVGIGKSRLLIQARRRAADAGARVLAARGGELERDFAFGVARQLFEPALLGSRSPSSRELPARLARGREGSLCGRAPRWLARVHGSPGRSVRSAPEVTAEPDDELWSAIGDPSRRRVLDLLVQRGEASASWLAERVPFSRQAVSKHLAVLEQAGLVGHRKQGREVLYQVDAERVDTAGQAMADVARQWDRRLEAMKQLAENTHATNRHERKR